ncbi:hypothetical protein Pmani_012133 [Petrolisthes manimaculis]|uniref:Uncharacterized protein n=1 Tax=Petrolisthes manimaculis TaxID=1843537 RepID=A0AAE1PXP6_9EUCA|nr:hypothetical protein Pmani_012133 [Petrolisthes manimaculis]
MARRQNLNKMWEARERKREGGRERQACQATAPSHPPRATRLHTLVFSTRVKTYLEYATKDKVLLSQKNDVYGVYRAVVRFNHGQLPAEAAEGSIGKESEKVLRRVMHRRVSNEKWREDKKEKSRKRKIRLVQEEAKKKAEEGETYFPGIAPLL